MINGQGVSVIALAAVFLLFNIIFIGLRVYTKARIAKTFGWNDVGMISVVLTYAGLMALLILGIKNGIGSHTLTVGLVKIGEALKYIWFLELIYVILTSIMKASVASTLLQWSRSRLHTTILWSAIFIDAGICLVFCLYLVLQCRPISYAWTFVDPTTKGKCLPFVGQLYMGYALCIVTITLDMIFLFLPFFMMKGRGVNRVMKGVVLGIFGLGVAASIANFIRLAALVKLKASADQLFDAVPVFAWSVVEVSIGIIVAGILELGPLMRRYNVKGFESYAVHAHERMDDDMEPLKLQTIVVTKDGGMI